MTLEKLCSIEQILDASSDELKKISDEEYLKFFDSALNVTRPDKVRATKKIERQPSLPYMSPGKKAAINKLADLGIDVDFLNKRKKYK